MAIIKNIKETMPTTVNSKAELNAPRPRITSSEQIVTPMNLLALDESGVFMWPNDQELSHAARDIRQPETLSANLKA